MRRAARASSALTPLGRTRKATSRAISCPSFSSLSPIPMSIFSDYCRNNHTSTLEYRIKHTQAVEHSCSTACVSFLCRCQQHHRLCYKWNPPHSVPLCKGIAFRRVREDDDVIHRNVEQMAQRTEVIHTGKADTLLPLVNRLRV